MKKFIFPLLFLMIFTKSWVFAASSGGTVKPFCEISEAAAKANSYFKEWLGGFGRAQEYKDYFIQEIKFSNYYESAGGNLLNGQWSWIIKFQSSSDSTVSYTLALKNDGKIEIINATE